MSNLAIVPKTQVKTVDFPAFDGYMLTGTRYISESAKATIVIASATGVPQQFYRRFAEYVTQHGYQVFTFDYRGVGASAPKKLANFQMSYLDWGQLDLAGAIDYVKQDQLPIFLVGHSYGGQALGLLPNHDLVKAMYCFGTGAGWHGYMPLGEKIKVQIIWNIVFPPLVALYDYLPWSKFNMGSDLPKPVYQQWRKWCKSSKYFFSDPDLTHLHTKYAELRTPIYAVSALDDAWALPASRHAFMQHYKNATMNYIDITAKQMGLKEIGHMGYFRKGATPIWNMIIQQFDELLK